MANGKFWKGIGNFFKRLFGGTKKIAEKVIPIGIEVAENLKLFLDSPITPLLTAIIPGTVDDLVAARLKQILPQVLANLNLANDCAKQTTPDKVVACVIAALKKLHPDDRDTYLLNIASKVNEALADGKLTWSEIVGLTDEIYKEKYK